MMREADGSRPSGGPKPPAAILWALGLGGVLSAVYLGRELVFLAFVSLALAYLLNPLVVALEGRAVRRDVAVAVLFLGIFALVLGLGVLLGPRIQAEMKTLTARLPSLSQEIDEALDALEESIVSVAPSAKRLFTGREARHARLDALIDRYTSNLPDFVNLLRSMFIGVVFVPLLSFFLLRDQRRIVGFVMDRLPRSQIETSVALWCEIDRIIGRYLRGVALDCLAVGTLAGLGLWGLGVRYALVLGAFAGLANAVPLLGPLLAGGLAAMAALVQWKSLAAPVTVVGLFVAVKLLDDVLIQPLTIGKGVRVHPVLLVASVIAGGKAFGVFGTVIAVPVVTVLQEATRLLLERRRLTARRSSPIGGARRAIPQYLC